MLVVFDDRIADMLSNKKPRYKGTKLNTFLVFITQTYFAVPKNIRLRSTHYFIAKIPNKLKL